MPRFVFKGRVFPATVALDFRNMPSIQWNPRDGGSIEITTTIVPSEHPELGEPSRIEINCDASSDAEDALMEAFKHGLAYSRCFVDMVSFSTGQGLTMVIETVTKPNGNTEWLNFPNPYLGGICTAYLMEGNVGNMIEFVEMLKKIAEEPPLFMAMNDLVSSLMNADVSAINCGRVLDSIRKIVAPNEKPIQGWRILRDILNCDEPYQRWVTELSHNPRHGDRTFIDGPTIQKSLARTWTLFNRFLEYRKRGNQSLPLAEFPVLNG